MNTCLMCHSLYVKANGELPCWDDAGEELILRKLDTERLQQLGEGIFYSTELQHIRHSFLQGKDPHPEFCKRCAVRGHGGGHNSLRPSTMDLLHLEASYLCHLSCPQCIPAVLRHKLKSPPYHMSPSFLEHLLRQLRSEGVAHIRVVHFEGRGDPLMNPRMDELIAVTKSAYPAAFTMITTHGSYRYKPWIVESGLDMLRVSIDGAFAESYKKYRVGGELETVLRFLRDIRDEKRRLGKHLQVDWKYILFEWNDSDEEIAEAARLANELDIRLRFVITHTPGKSRRFIDADALKLTLTTVAPAALIETTFPMKSQQLRDNVDAVVSDEVATLLQRSLEAVRRHDIKAACMAASKALEYDPGIATRTASLDCGALLTACVSEVIAKARFPTTLSGLAAIAHEVGHSAHSKRLFSRYLVMAAREHLRKKSSQRFCGALDSGSA